MGISTVNSVDLGERFGPENRRRFIRERGLNIRICFAPFSKAALSREVMKSSYCGSKGRRLVQELDRRPVAHEIPDTGAKRSFDVQRRLDLCHEPMGHG